MRQEKLLKKMKLLAKRGLLWGMIAGMTLASVAQSSVRFPFATGKSWYICQGYNSKYTHHDNPMLDFSTSPVSPVDGGCNNKDEESMRASAGEFIVAPFSGKLSSLYRVDMVCVTANDGSKSMKIGHFWLDDKFKGTNGEIISGAPVTVNETMGKVMEPIDRFNNGISHIHVSIHKGPGCADSSAPVPFVGDMAFEGVGDLPYDGSPNQHAGLKVTNSASLFPQFSQVYFIGMLARARGDTKVYRISVDERGMVVKRWITANPSDPQSTGEKVFFANGFSFSDVHDVPKQEVDNIPTGNEITGVLSGDQKPQTLTPPLAGVGGELTLTARTPLPYGHYDVDPFVIPYRLNDTNNVSPFSSK